VVLEANHYYFEDLLEFGPEAQHALSVIYRDAFAVLDALGWAPAPERGMVDVLLTDGHVERLRRRRYDLAHANLDRLPAPDQPVSAETRGHVGAGGDEGKRVPSRCCRRSQHLRDSASAILEYPCR
jgi:hypothetical protein